MPAPVSVPLPEYLPLMNRADFEQNRARSRAWARARKIRTVLNLDDLALGKRVYPKIQCGSAGIL